jgi:membrane-bound inhibitor of C-type lysozyme
MNKTPAAVCSTPAPAPRPVLGAAAVLVAALTLAACSPSPAPAPAPAPVTTPAPAPEPAVEMTTEFNEVNFTCGEAMMAQVRFFPQQGVAVLVRDGQTLEMQQEPVASGFAYRGGATAIRGQDDELVIETEGEPVLECRAQ